MLFERSTIDVDGFSGSLKGLLLGIPIYVEAFEGWRICMATVTVFLQDNSDYYTDVLVTRHGSPSLSAAAPMGRNTCLNRLGSRQCQQY